MKIALKLINLVLVSSLASCAVYNSPADQQYLAQTYATTKPVFLAERSDWHLDQPSTPYFVFDPAYSRSSAGGLYEYDSPSLAQFKSNPQQWQQARYPSYPNKLNGLELALFGGARFKTLAILAVGTKFQMKEIYDVTWSEPEGVLIQIISGSYAGTKAIAVYTHKGDVAYGGAAKFTPPTWARVLSQ